MFEFLLKFKKRELLGSKFIFVFIPKQPGNIILKTFFKEEGAHRGKSAQGL